MRTRGSDGSSVICETNPLLGHTPSSSAKAQAVAPPAIAARVRSRTVLNGSHSRASNFLETFPPFPFGPSRFCILNRESRDIEYFQITVALMLGHREHEGSGVESTGDQPPRTPVETESIPRGEEETEHHLKSADSRMRLGHDEDEPFSCRGRVGVNHDIALDFDEGRRIDQGFRLGIERVCRVRVGNGGNGLSLLLFLGGQPRVVKLDVALELGNRPIVGRLLLHVLYCLCVLLLVGRADDTPAASPGHTSAEPDTNPFLGLETRPLHDNIDVVESLALAGNESTGVRLLESGELVYSQADAGGPLDKRVVGVEVEKISVPAGGRDAQDVL